MTPAQSKKNKADSTIFGTMPEGEKIVRHQISNGGTSISVLSWGATIQELRVMGESHSLLLGGRDVTAYLGSMQYFGAVVGPVANRIAGAEMEIGGIRHQLDQNEAGRTTLHSGVAGYSGRNWRFTNVTPTRCRLELHHPDGLGGIPGNIDASVTYTIDTAGHLEIEMTGAADQPTYFNPAFHGYWNLSGSADLSDHRLMVPATSYLAVDDAQLPLGAPVSVAGSEFDYRHARAIGSVLDHNFCLSQGGDQMVLACRLSTQRLQLDVLTDQPGVQLYNGAHIDTGADLDVDGGSYGPHAGLAIEPQFWPDTPHHPEYPDCLLLPEKPVRYRSRFELRRI